MIALLFGLIGFVSLIVVVAWFLQEFTGRKVIVGVGITALIIGLYLFLYAIGPVLLAGDPLPLFSIRNHDSKSHEVIIEVVDSNNNSVLKEVYQIEPGGRVRYERGFGWYPKITLYAITWSEGVYTFKITLDGKIRETYTTRVYPHQEVTITLYGSLNGKPVAISEVVV